MSLNGTTLFELRYVSYFQKVYTEWMKNSPIIYNKNTSIPDMMRVSTALDAFWISRIGQPGYSLIPRYESLREFDSQSNSQILIVIIQTFCRFGHIVDTSVICSLHQWCSQPQGRWWRGIKLWVSSIFHKDAPTHTTLIMLHSTRIWSYSIWNYRHHHISYLTHITTILLFIFDP